MTTTTEAIKVPKYKDFILGVGQSLPLLIGYATIGIPFGILAFQIGMPHRAIIFMGVGMRLFFPMSSIEDCTDAVDPQTRLRRQRV